MDNVLGSLYLGYGNGKVPALAVTIAITVFEPLQPGVGRLLRGDLSMAYSYGRRGL